MKKLSTWINCLKFSSYNSYYVNFRKTNESNRKFYLKIINKCSRAIRLLGHRFSFASADPNRFFNPITDISSEAAIIVEITPATVNY